MKFSEEEKAMWLEDWRRSGKKAWTYAKGNGLVPQTFVKWANAKPDGAPRFVEVKASAAPESGGGELLVEKGEVKIHVPLTVCAGELRTIINALGGTV